MASLAWATLVVGVVSTLAHAVAASGEGLSISLPRWVEQLNAASHTLTEDDAQRASTEQLLRSFPRDQTLLQWASSFKEGDVASPSTRDGDASVFLVIGAKTSVVHGFANRQALRQTWASDTSRPHGVRVVFLGCEPDLSMFDATKQRRLRAAVALEKRVFGGDLLTDELLACADAFAGLAHKVRAFYRWAALTHAPLSYAMVVDDDVFLRLDMLVETLRDETRTPRARFFGGNSVTDEYAGLATPVRDPRHKYFVSRAAYPLAQLPPFLSGAHYVLSADLVRFLARNVASLQGLGALDDVSVGLWLFATRHVSLTFMREFQVLRHAKACREDLVSLADLTTTAMRVIHSNLRAARPLCRAFHDLDWTKRVRTIIVSNATDSDSSSDGLTGTESVLRWDVQFDQAASRLQLEITLTAGEQSVSFAYVPSLVTTREGFCAQAAKLLQEKLFLSAGDELCVHYRRLLLRALDDMARNEPGMRALLRLVRHNLERSQAFDAALERELAAAIAENRFVSREEPPPLIVLLSASTKWRVLVECLVVQRYGDRHILVLSDDDDGEVDTRRANADLCVGVSFEDDGYSDDSAWMHAAHRRNCELLLLVDRTSRADSERRATVTAVVASVSRAFARTAQHTPHQLLHPTISSSSTDRSFAVYAASRCQRRLPANVQLSLLVEMLVQAASEDASVSVDSFDACDAAPFYLDAMVETLRRYKFTLVAADSTNGGASDVVVAAALLAGSVPVLLGGTSSELLFNADALLACASTPRECAGRVLEAHASLVVYERLRHAPPVGAAANAVFAEICAWHPGVAARH